MADHSSQPTVTTIMNTSDNNMDKITFDIVLDQTYFDAIKLLVVLQIRAVFLQPSITV